jgi:uncharacterized damage-inducible protein DinB
MSDHLRAVLRRSFDGRAWHGPALAEALAGVDARAALARPVADAHTIWELTHHIAAWAREVARRLDTGEAAMPADGDWPDPVTETDPDRLDAAWSAMRRRLDDARDELLAALGRLPAERLDERVSDLSDPALGGRVTYAQMLIGLAEHNAYHGGQIVLLRRLIDGTRLSGYGGGEASSVPPDPSTITES